MIQEELTALIRMYPAGSSEAEKALVEVAEEIAKAAQRSSHSKNRLKNGDLNKNDDDDDDDFTNFRFHSNNFFMCISIIRYINKFINSRCVYFFKFGG